MWLMEVGAHKKTKPTSIFLIEINAVILMLRKATHSEVHTSNRRRTLSLM